MYEKQTNYHRIGVIAVLIQKSGKILIEFSKHLTGKDSNGS